MARKPSTDKRLVLTWTVCAWPVISATWFALYLTSGHMLDLVIAALRVPMGIFKAREWHAQRERRAALRAASH